MGRGFLASRGMDANRGPRMTCHVGWLWPGEENEPAVADADRAEQSEAAFGQTCPIETAGDVPRPHRKARQWRAAALLRQRHGHPSISCLEAS
jgi:hypothetical protein